MLVRRLRTGPIGDIGDYPGVGEKSQPVFGGQHFDPQAKDSAMDATGSDNVNVPLEIGSEWVGGYTTRDMSRLQLQDPDISVILRHMLDRGARPERDKIAAHSPATRNLWLLWESLEIRDGVLYIRRQIGDYMDKLQLVLPAILVPRVIKACHNSLLTAHLGVKKTIGKVESCFYWYRIKKTLQNGFASANFVVRKKDQNKDQKEK